MTLTRVSKMFNVLFTSLPILMYGIWEQDVSPEIAMKAPPLLELINVLAQLTACVGWQHPELYRPGQQDTLFNKKTFTRWV